MPIGLPEIGYRKCDLLARNILGPRRATLFTVPSRAAFSAETYAESCQKNLPRQGVKLSKQVWNIFPKIKELESLLLSAPGLSETLIEAHPELAFCRLNQNKPLLNPKRTKEGRIERLNLLTSIFDQASIEMLLSSPGYSKFVEDIIDATSLVALLKLSEGNPKFLEDQSVDKFGLPMQLAY